MQLLSITLHLHFEDNFIFIDDSMKILMHLELTKKCVCKWFEWVVLYNAITIAIILVNG